MTLSELLVKADNDEEIVNDFDTGPVTGQTLITPENASLENYWILILASVLLLLLWSCCFYWVRGIFQTAGGGVRCHTVPYGCAEQVLSLIHI